MSGLPGACSVFLKAMRDTPERRRPRSHRALERSSRRYGWLAGSDRHCGEWSCAVARPCPESSPRRGLQVRGKVGTRRFLDKRSRYGTYLGRALCGRCAFLIENGALADGHGRRAGVAGGRGLGRRSSQRFARRCRRLRLTIGPLAARFCSSVGKRPGVLCVTQTLRCFMEMSSPPSSSRALSSET